MASDLPSLAALMERLRAEHRPGHVYRGQVRRWPEPLVPSEYRPFIEPDADEGYEPSARLKELGQRFHGLGPLEKAGLSVAAREHMQANVVIRQYFGYPFGQLVSQLFGFPLGGLNVTRAVEDAGFFAAFDLSLRAFVRESPEPGVIHRFEVPADGPALDLDQLGNMTLYDCPTYVDTAAMLRGLAAVGVSDEEALGTWLTFRRIAAASGARLRPFEFLKLPLAIVEGNRTVRQGAGLLFPDLLLSMSYRRFAKAPPAGKAEREGDNAVEDLSKRSGAESFAFRHAAGDAQCLDHAPEHYYPKPDTLLVWLHGMLAGEFGPQDVFYTEIGDVGAGRIPYPEMPLE